MRRYRHPLNLHARRVRRLIGRHRLARIRHPLRLVAIKATDHVSEHFRDFQDRLHDLQRGCIINEFPIRMSQLGRTTTAVPPSPACGSALPTRGAGGEAAHAH